MEVVEAPQPNFHIAGAGEAELDRAAVFEFFVFETEGGIFLENLLMLSLFGNIGTLLRRVRVLR